MPSVRVRLPTTPLTVASSASPCSTKLEKSTIPTSPFTRAHSAAPAVKPLISNGIAATASTVRSVAELT